LRSIVELVLDVNYLKELLPVSAILLVILAMAGVDLVIIGEPARLVSVVPVLLVLVLWFAAMLKTRRA
jgi:hypothetical protein